jgi:hypothetical protein
MRRATLLAAAALVALPVTATPAHAALSNRGPGLLCGFASILDPRARSGDVQSGEVDAGPLIVTDEAGLPASALLFCTIQVGGAIHSDPDNGATASTFGTGVLVLPPTPVSYIAAYSPVYICSEIVYAGGHKTLYWAEPDDPADGYWTEDPSAPCARATTARGSKAVSPFLDPIFEVADVMVCPVLGVVPVVNATLQEIWGDCF